MLINWLIGTLQVAKSHDQAAERHLSRGCVGVFQSADWAVVKWLTGTDEAAGRRCLSGLQVLIKQLTGADQLAEKC